MEEKAGPGQKNTLSKMRRDSQAMAQNLRLRTKRVSPEREHSPTGQDEKNNFLDASRFRAFLVLGYAFLDELCHERGREGLVRREVEGGTADIVPFEFACSHARQLGNHARAH